jgi:hypothetical protein
MVDNNTDSLYTINLARAAANLIGSTGTGNFLGLVYIPDARTGFDRFKETKKRKRMLLGFGAALFAARRWGGLGKSKRKTFRPLTHREARLRC